MTGAPSRIGGLLLGAALAFAASGCGNQMMRQPSYTPLDVPRSAPPAGSVPVGPALMPGEARLVSAPAFGSTPTLAPEPALPPPNLSDNARNEPTPKAVDAIRNPLPANASYVSQGRTLFLNRCVQCHNSSGWGFGPVGEYLVPHPPDLASTIVQKRSDGAIFWHVSMGQGKMPGFRNWTTTAQRWELVDYVRSLRGAPRRQASDTPAAPYPVYGEVGFEQGDKTDAYKTLPADPVVQRNIRQTHFWQWTHQGGLP